MKDDNPSCPHCGQELRKWETPTFQFGDGLGWGTDFLYVCFNDNCPLYVKGWETMEENYGHNMSVRYARDESGKMETAVPVATEVALKGDIIEETKTP